MKGFLINAWRYRQFILSSIRNDLHARFARNALGGVWMVLHPLAQVAVFALVLSGVFAARLGGLEGPFAYAIYLTAGTMAWTLFAELVTRGQMLFIDNGNLLKKIAFPKICLPLILTGSALVNNSALALVALAFYALVGHWPGWLVLWLVPLYAVVVAFGLGLGLLLGVLNVFIRDIGQMTPIVLQFWFWFTPIIYMASILPAGAQPWMRFNPMFHVVDGFQAVLVFKTAPAMGGLVLVAGLALGLMALALWCLRAAGQEMADVL
ncbi:ABC transporter permease [Thauera aromatica]|uniref:ABC transporter permease n=1 Tax=Thauera aromatica TaxID=59405 RepID=UPI001FFC6ADF|nr:ABC transporter permease [Thauera aromatica]MCK2089596.1 ABC transporter permease [Thauera aromatica]